MNIVLELQFKIWAIKNLDIGEFSSYFFLKIVGMRVLVLFQEMYPDRLLVSPAPAGGNTNWFDPFFQVLLWKIQSWAIIVFVFAIMVVFSQPEF